MRVLAKIVLDVEMSNATIATGRHEQVLANTFAVSEPEAVYFLMEDGKRTTYVVFDLKDPGDLVAIAEPWYNSGALSVNFWPVMVREDLKSGLTKSSRSRRDQKEK